MELDRKSAASLRIIIWNLSKRANAPKSYLGSFARGYDHEVRTWQEDLATPGSSFHLAQPGRFNCAETPWHVLRWRKPQRMGIDLSLGDFEFMGDFHVNSQKITKDIPNHEYIEHELSILQEIQHLNPSLLFNLRNDMILYRSRKPPKVSALSTSFWTVFFHRNSVQSLGKKWKTSSVSTGIRMLSFWSMVGPWHLWSSSCFPSSPQDLRQLQPRQCQMSWVVWRRGHWPSRYGVAVLWVWCNSMQVTGHRFRWF